MTSRNASDWWPEVDAKLARRERRAVQAKSAAVTLGLALAVSGAVFWRTSPAPPEVAAPTQGSKLALVSGTGATTWEPQAQNEAVCFSDKSCLTVEPGAVLSWTKNDDTHVQFALSHGKLSASVTPGGPRRWVIDTPLATIEVLGTQFTLDAQEGHLSVAVSRGLVSVRGPTVPGGERKLRAGESLNVEASVESPAAPAVATPQSVPLEVPEPTVDALWASADDARLKGDHEAAATHLERIVKVYPHHAQSGLAAFLAGRIAQEQRGQSAAALSLYETALRLGLEPTLREDACRRGLSLGGADLPCAP